MSIICVTNTPKPTPPNLPVVCWVQDHLLNLIDAAAGPSITPRDFFLAGGFGLVNLYNYPARQHIFMGKVTRFQPPPGRISDTLKETPDIALVSNCSRQAAEMIPELLEHYPPLMQPMVQACCEQIIESYANDQSFSQMPDIMEIVERESQRHQLDLGAENTRMLVACSLWHPLNDTLYRQQAIRWSIRAAKRLNLTLGLYGNGWEDHPEFAEHARGYIDYGADLEELTRRCPINLHIVPFGCMHQRFLDGAMANGFFLMRDHPKNHPAYDLIEFVETHCKPGAANYPQASDGLTEERQNQLDQLIQSHRRLYYAGDVVERVMANRGQCPDDMPPHYDEIAFDDEASFNQRLDKFINNSEARQNIVRDQRDFVQQHFTYESHITRVLDRITHLISTEDA